MLVGRDGFGNEYFENRLYQTSACHPSRARPPADGSGADRERWVMYADKSEYKANEVPPDWHGAAPARLLTWLQR